MGDKLSNVGLYDALAAGGETRDAILNPVTDSETFSSNIAKWGVGALDNVSNLFGNAYDVLDDVDTSAVLKKAKAIRDNPELDLAEKTWEVLKSPFGATPSSPLNKLLGVEDATGKVLESINQDIAGYARKNELAKQYGGGGFGNLASELVGAAPIMKIGNMARTNSALANNASKVDIAKSISMDAIENSTTMSASEFLLAKAYGRSDEEAVANALMAKLAGGVGTIAVGAGKTLKHSIGAEERALRANFEAGGSYAGGGKPPKVTPQDADIGYSEPKRKRTEAEASKKIVGDIEYDVVDPKLNAGEDLVGQSFVPTVNNPKKYSYKFGVNGRVFNEEANLLAPQGTSVQKASLKQKQSNVISNASDEVDRRLNFYDSDVKLRKAYGQAQTKYKKSTDSTVSRDEFNRLEFQKSQYKDIMKDKSLSTDVRLEAKMELSKLKDVTIDKTADDVVKSKSLDKAISDFNVRQPKNLKAREIELRDEYKAYERSLKSKEGYTEKGTIDVTTDAGVESLVKGISANRGAKLDFVNAVSEISKKEKLLAKSFDYADISRKQRATYRDEIKVIDDYINTNVDLHEFKKGAISADELKYRAKRRLDESLQQGDSTFKDSAEAIERDAEISKQYADIGVYRKESIKTKDVKSSGSKPKEADPVKEAKELEKSKSIHSSVIKSIAKYRSTKIRERRTTSDAGKGGQYKLSDTTIRDIDEGILTNKEIADKISPIGLDADRKQLIEDAKALANSKATKAKAEELGIDPEKGIKLPDYISFKDTTVDASNSVMQIASVLLGKRSLGKLSKLTGDNTDVRVIIGDELTSKLGYNVDKAMVKPIFMTKNYGQGDKGLIKNLMKENGFDRRTATEFLNAYYEAERKLIPDLANLQDLIYSRIKEGKDPKISWYLPDGFKVELDISKELDGSFSLKGLEVPIKIKSANIDEMSRSIMPNVIHSVDAYVARRMNAKGIPSIHDAFTVPKGMDNVAKEEYGKIMSEINDSPLLKNILDDIGVDSSNLPKRDLTSEDIMKSEHKLGMEHEAGSSLDAGDYEKSIRGLDLSRASTKDEVMKDFMATGNVRQLSTPQLIDGLVNEASYRTMSVAKNTDDVFERQVAMAHQSPDYNPDFEIKPPSGVNEESWFRNQREVFDEARAKLEYNPMLTDVIQGERKYFTTNQRIIGDDETLYKEFTDAETKVFDDTAPFKNGEIKESLDSTGKDFPEIKDEVNSWSDTKNLNEDEIFAKKTVNEATDAVQEKMSTETLSGIKRYFTDQYKPSKEGNAFQRLYNLRKFRSDEVNLRSEVLLNEMNKVLKGEDNALWTKHLLDTDFHSIRHFDEGMADEYMAEFNHVYEKAKLYIDQSVKALNDESKQIGAYLNNSSLIADAVGLGREFDPIIDKLISLKAMTPESWKFVESKRGTPAFDLSMDVLSEVRKKSVNNFSGNKAGYSKGWLKEHYDGGKQIVDQQVVYDAEMKRQSGAVPNTLESKKVGAVTDEVKVDYSNMDGFKTREEMLRFAERKNYKVTEKGFRLVQNRELRDEAGRSSDFARIITDTMHSIDEKEVGRQIEKDILDELTLDDSLISTKTKPGFREITMDERAGLPQSLQGKVRYVHEDYYDRIMGRDEVRLTQANKFEAGANQSFKVADRLLADFAGMFKQNVVLKNVSSFKNAIFVNQSIGAMAGVNPRQAYKWQKEVVEQIRRNDNLRNKMSMLKATGKDASAIEARLEKSELYQMEKLGLSLNQLDGVRGDSTLLSHMLSDATGHRFDKIANEIFMNQKSHAGRFTTSLFSTIDTQGRFMLTKRFMEDGLSMKESVNKANGLFSDMDQMAPVFVEALDKYGAIPFLKWFTRTTPQLMKLTKDNPKKTIALSIALYTLSVETDLNFNSINPIEAAIDFADNAVSLDYIESVSKRGFADSTVRKLTPYVLPNVWKDLDRLTTDVGDDYSLAPGTKTKSYNPLFKPRLTKPWSDKSMDYRGLTQQVIEGN